MAIQVGDNFSYQGAKPLDTRLQYATIAEMKAKADSTLYDGIIAYCKADGKNYQWKSTNTVDPTLGKWREFQSGGGGTSELANLDDVDLDDPADGEVLKYNATEEKWVNGEDVGGAGRAKSSAIAPVFDDTATYAAGDRVTYEDELYVFNKAHTGAWVAADADKSDVDSEIPDKLTSQQMQAIKDAFVIDTPRTGYPVLFDETGAEHFVGWYKYANGTKKPVYEKTISGTASASMVLLSDVDKVIFAFGAMRHSGGSWLSIPFSWQSSERFLLWTNSGNKAIAEVIGTSYIGQPYYIILRYTKTTDTPQ